MDAPTDLADLPFDPARMDIACRRDPDGTRHFNIRQAIVHHSPTGMEWGHGGSGPADLALNVLALFVPCPQAPSPDLPGDEDAATWARWEAAVAGDDRVELRDGSYVAAAVWDHYHDFKAEVIAALPEEGGTIAGDDVRAWLRARGVEPAR